jgi:hypothetical protein
VSRPAASTTGGFKPLPDTAECCISCNKACISNQVTIRRRAAASPTAPRGPQRAEARDRLPRRGRQDAAPASRPGSVGDLDPDGAVSGDDRDCNRFPGSTRAGVPDTVAEYLADQQDGHVSAWVPGAERLRDECSGGPRPLRPPGERHALPDGQPSHHRTRPSPAAPPRETGRAAGGRRDMHAQLRRERQADTTGLRRPLPVARPWSRPPSVAVRAKPTVPRTAPRPRFSSATRPWTPQHNGLQRPKVTHAGTEKNAPPARDIAASGAFSQRVAGDGFEPS